LLKTSSQLYSVVSLAVSNRLSTNKSFSYDTVYSGHRKYVTQMRSATKHLALK